MQHTRRQNSGRLSEVAGEGDCGSSLHAYAHGGTGVERGERDVSMELENTQTKKRTDKYSKLARLSSKAMWACYCGAVDHVVGGKEEEVRVR